MRIITIDCSDIRSETEFWQRYIDVARPQGADIFGRNLDAFEDALEGGPGCPGNVQLHFTNTAHLCGLRSGAFLAALKEIASERATVTIS